MAAAKRPLRIVIIGAGIGGLAAAVALRQRGYDGAVRARHQT
jgi:2-polyprenyl-6-methoxyphenol hydroxylase-like FAD-dependent oxidoreductase